MFVTMPTKFVAIIWILILIWNLVQSFAITLDNPSNEALLLLLYPREHLLAQAINKVVQAGIRNQEIREYSTEGHRQERGQREHINGVKPGDLLIHKLQRLYTITNNKYNGGGVQTINIMTHKTRDN